MPRKKKPAEPATPPAATPTPANGEHESIAGYFRKVFKESPELLKERSNEPLYQRWLGDHPGHKEVPQNVKTGLQNLKSVLRHKKRQKAARRRQQAQAAAESPAAQQRTPEAVGGPLERLEGMIDECLAVARGLEDRSLEAVIGLLRQARNELILRARGKG